MGLCKEWFLPFEVCLKSRLLYLELSERLGQWRSAHVLPLEMEIHIHMVRNTNERYALIHAVVLAVEDHRSVKFAGTGALTGDR